MRATPEVINHQTHILIVDDERPNRQLLEVMLTPERFILHTAASGEEALAKIAERPPDLILLDIMMPGMDGYQVVAKLKGDSATRNIPVILVTALDDRNARMRGLSAGAEDFLSKPVDRAELCARVRNLLRLKAYGDFHQNYGLMLEAEVGTRTAELVESERIYRETFDAAPVGIVHVDLQGRWLHVNQYLCELLGYPRDALKSSCGGEGIQTDAFVPSTAPFEAMVAGTLERHVIEELRFRCADGKFVWVKAKVAVHRSADGTPQHFIAVIEDITERRTLEAQLRQASKMDAIGRLAAGVAHDFNNLLTVIVGFTEFVIGDGALTPRHAKDLQEVVSAARRATALTGQLLAFSRQQVLKAAPVDVNALITDMARMLNRLIGEQVQVSLTLGANVSMALADRGQVEQVVMNLVVNARDAMPDGGSVTIETADVELENSGFHDAVVVPGCYVMVAVADTGIGMTKEVQRRLFEPFFTTKESGKGTGLGLSTTYGIVKQSNGYLWVYSAVGQGTTFKVYLPRAVQLEAREAASLLLTPTRRGSETVLLVEDEPGVRELSKRILENAGYKVIDAVDGLDAEHLFTIHGSAIDLVISDLSMPRCDGPEMMRRLHIHAPSLKVLYMSGYTEQSAAQRAGIDSGISVLQKPFTATGLIHRVREVLDRRQPATASSSIAIPSA